MPPPADLPLSSPDVCIPVRLAPDAQIELLGGVIIKAIQGVDTGDPMAILQGLVAAAMPFLAILQPIFSLMGLATGILDVVTALVGPPPDLVKAGKALIKLAGYASQVADLAPALAVPAMIKSLLKIIVLLLQAIQQKLDELIAQKARIDGMVYRAASAPDLAKEYAPIIACEQAALDATMSNMARSVGSLDALMGIVNGLLSLVPGMPQVPKFDDLGPDPQGAMDTIDVIVDALNVVVGAIP